MRLATGTLVKADVSNDDEQDEHEQGDPVSVHLPPRHLRVLAADDAVPSATGGSGARGGSRWMSRPQTTPRPARPGGSDSRRAELIEAARRVIQRRGFAKATVGRHHRRGGRQPRAAQLPLRLARRRRRRGLRGGRARRPRRAGGDLAPPRRSARARWPPTSTSRRWADRDVWRMWIDAWGEAVHTEQLRRTLEQFERGWRAVLAGVLADGDRQRLLALRRIPRTRRAAGRRARRARAAHDAAPRRRRARGGGALGAPAGRARARRDAARSARSRARRGRRRRPTRSASPSAGATSTPPGACIRPSCSPTSARCARRGSTRAWAASSPVPALEVAHVSADFRHVPARRDAEVVVRCALDGLGTTGVRTRETIETVGGALVVSAGATVVADRRGRRAAAADRARARSAAAMSARALGQAEVARDRRPDLGAGALERHLRVAGEHADAVAVDERQQAVGHLPRRRSRAARRSRRRRRSPARTTRAGARRGGRPRAAAPDRGRCAATARPTARSRRAARDRWAGTGRSSPPGAAPAVARPSSRAARRRSPARS